MLSTLAGEAAVNTHRARNTPEKELICEGAFEKEFCCLVNDASGKLRKKHNKPQ